MDQSVVEASLIEVHSLFGTHIPIKVLHECLGKHNYNVDKAFEDLWKLSQVHNDTLEIEISVLYCSIAIFHLFNAGS